MAYELTEVDDSVVEEVERFKSALANTLLKKSLETKDEKAGALLYTLSKVLSSMRVVKSSGVSIAAMDRDIIYIGPLYKKFLDNVRKKNPDGVRRAEAFILLHEAMHRMYGHDVRMKLASDKLLYNLVADLYVNTILSKYLRAWDIEGIVTLDNLSNFIIENYGVRLTSEQKRAIIDLGKYEVEDKVSVDQAYNTLMMLPRDIQEAVIKKFASGKFFGKDLSRGSDSSTGSSNSSSEGTDSNSSGKQQQAGNSSGSTESGASNVKQEQVDIGKASKAGDELSKQLEEIGNELRKIAREISQAEGEYKAMRKMHGKNAGTGKGVMGHSEYKQLTSLTLHVHRLFMKDVGETLTEPKASFERFDEEAYWLPAREAERRKTVLALVDASPSVPIEHLNLFLSCIVNSAHAFDLEYRLVVFGTGKLKEATVSPDNIHGEIQRVPLGLGTVWDETIAESIRDSTARGVRLIQVLSDFWVDVRDEAYRAIAEFKNAGGRIACYSSSGDFLDICDFRYRLPVIPK